MKKHASFLGLEPPPPHSWDIEVSDPSLSVKAEDCLPPVRPEKNTILTSENEKGCELVKAGRDVQTVIMDRLPTIKECVQLISSCYTLWSKHHTYLYQRIVREVAKSHEVDSLSYLVDVLEFNPHLRASGLNYQHLALILSRAKYWLETMVASDPECDWKIAAICGMEDLVFEILGENISTTIDLFGRGVLSYYALGGQLECLKRCIEKYFQSPLDQTTLSNLAKMAALGGHVHVLEYLRDVHHFKLNHVYPPSEEGKTSETLLVPAVTGGNEETIRFLKREENELDQTIGLNPALYASAVGNWKLYHTLNDENPIVNVEKDRDLVAKGEDPISNIEDAILVAKDAVSTGNLPLALTLIDLYKIDPKTLAPDIIKGGNPIVFRHALEKEWFALSDTFENGASVQHLLAENGHLSLLKVVLKDPKAKTETLIVDDNPVLTHPACVKDHYGQTPLHYAAVGGHWNVLNFLHFEQNIPFTEDNQGCTVSHCAARRGRVWFLKKLFKTPDGPQLMQAKGFNQSSTLFDAAYTFNPAILILMIEEFGVKLESTDSEGNTVFHFLATLAEKNPIYWDTLTALIARYPHSSLLNLPNSENPPKTVREMIIAGGEEVNFPNVLSHLLLEEQELNLIN